MVLVLAPEGKGPLERRRYEWKGSIKTNLKWDGDSGLDLSADRAKWRAVVEWVNFGYNKIRGISGLAEDLSTSQQGLSYVELVPRLQLEL
jgi:hypothetical protein